VKAIINKRKANSINEKQRENEESSQAAKRRAAKATYQYVAAAAKLARAEAGIEAAWHGGEGETNES